MGGFRVNKVGKNNYIACLRLLYFYVLANEKKISTKDNIVEEEFY